MKKLFAAGALGLLPMFGAAQTGGTAAPDTVGFGSLAPVTVSEESATRRLTPTEPLAINLAFERTVQIADNRRNPGEAAPIALGDIDGDGFADLALGAPRASGFFTVDSGMVYVRFGEDYFNKVPIAQDDQAMYYDLTAPPEQMAAGVFSSVTIEDALGRIPSGIQIFPERGGGSFGAAVAMGDFNGDNFTDLAIAAPNRFSTTQPGTVYLVFGRADIGGHVFIEGEIFDGRAVEITGRAANARFGERLLMADIDGDGFDDLIIGTPREGTGGVVDIIFGGASALPFQRAPIDSLAIPRTRIVSNIAGERLGTGLAAGDFSGDSGKELALGAPRWPSEANGNGRVVVLNLAGTRPTTIDLAVTVPYLTIQSSFTQSGLGTAIAIGDFDADSVNDLVASSPLQNAGGNINGGAVYVISNPSSMAGGTVSVPAAAATIIEGGVREFLGTALAMGRYDLAVGDELIVGAPGFDRGGVTDTGAVFLYRSGTIPTGTIDRFEPDLPITRFDVEREGFELGTHLTMGDFDGQNQLDVFMAGSGNQDFSALCGTDDQAGYDFCHRNREGVMVYGALSGTVDVPSVRLSVRRGWMLLE